MANVVFDGKNPFTAHQIDRGVLFGFYNDDTHLYKKDSIIDLSTLPSSFKSISRFCFINNKRIKTFFSNNNLRSIGNNAFTNTSLEKVVINGNADYIGIECFAYCSNLTMVEIHSECVNIEDFAFAYCSNLKILKIKGFANIMPSALIGCSNLEEIHIGACDLRYFKKVTIPETATIHAKKESSLYKYCLKNGKNVREEQ